MMQSPRAFAGRTGMTLTEARNAVIVLSFATSLAALVFFLLSHFFLPLDPSQSFQIAQMIVPVFIGYVGSCVYFIFAPEPVNPKVNNGFLLRVMIYGPFLFFWIASIAFVLNFYFSNKRGDLVRYETLSEQFTFILSFMTLTTGALTVYLFGKKED
jgi:hypothetical protein